MSAPSSTARVIVRGATVILVVTLVARIVGFLRYLVFGASVGAGDVGTAYSSANLVPNLLFEVAAGGALAASVVPLVAGLVENDETGEGRRRADGIISAMLSWMLLLTIPLALLVGLLAGPIASLVLTSGDSDESVVELGASMLRIFALQLPMYGVTVVLGAYLQARKRFLWPALVPLLSSLVVIISYRVYAAAVPAVATASTISPFAHGVLAWGTTAGVVVMALSVLVPAARAGLRLRPTLRMPAGMGSRAVRLAGAGLGAVGAQQLALALVLLLAMRTGGTGTLPVFQYGQAIYLLPYAVLVVPLITSVFPHLSEQRLVGDLRGFAVTARASLRSVVVIGTVGAATLFAAGPALEAFFHHIDRAGAVGVGAVVAALSVGLLPYAITMQCTRVLSAAMRARDALLVGSVGWVVGGILIVVVAVLSNSGSAAVAATAFAFALSAGMWVSGITGLARVADLLEGVEGGAPLVRVVPIGAVVSVAAAIPGLLLGRAMVDQGTSEVLCVLIGVLTGGTGMVLALAAMALADRRTAASLLARLRRGRTEQA
ncbi:murein biosynthesis integral membrane protein MurJ [Brachybacterium subflavum]|uniref:murein biosynthesis integral membrane protein MurJ n=1 Tax=Brachybacterium subflavum TaxID=2585206 RepID=UPI0012665D7F|nr:lipid II flippase MurJ [Brachybacterium subflavum]